MPQPSSITRIRRLPPDSVSIRIERAPASSAFSSSSFTTEAGRSTTSPAAIFLASFVLGLFVFLGQAAQKNPRAKQTRHEDHQHERNAKPLRKRRHLHHHQKNEPDHHTHPQQHHELHAQAKPLHAPHQQEYPQ